MPLATLTWDAQPADAGAVAARAPRRRRGRAASPTSRGRTTWRASCLSPGRCGRCPGRWQWPASASATAAGTATSRHHSSTPGGPSSRCGRHTPIGRWPSSATRWGAGSPCTSATRPTCGSWWPSRPGSSRATPSPGRGAAPSSSTATATSSAGCPARGGSSSSCSRRGVTRRSSGSRAATTPCCCEPGSGPSSSRASPPPTFADELGIGGDGAEPRSGVVGAAIALAVHGGGSVIDL